MILHSHHAKKYQTLKLLLQAAVPVLRYRILANFAADPEGITTTALAERLLKTIEQPDDKDY